MPKDIITGVPEYIQTGGKGLIETGGECASTSIASILAYWDFNGYGNLFEDASYATETVKDDVDVLENKYGINEYASLAFRSLSDNVERYAENKGYKFTVDKIPFDGKDGRSGWEIMVDEIKAGRPIAAIVSQTRDHVTGLPLKDDVYHLVPVVGYEENEKGRFYFHYDNYAVGGTGDIIKSAWVEWSDEKLLWEQFTLADEWSVEAFYTIHPGESKPDSAVEELVNLARETYIGPTLSPLISEPGSRREPPKDAPVPENEQILPDAPSTGSAPPIEASMPEIKEVEPNNPSPPPTVPTPENVQDLGGNPPSGSAPEPGSGPEPVDVALKDLPPPPPVPVPPSAPPPSAEESAPEPRDTVQDLGGEKPSGDAADEEEKFAFDDLPPPPDIPPPPPPSFSPDEVSGLDGGESTSPERELAEDRTPEPPASETVQDLGGNEPTAPDDILLG